MSAATKTPTKRNTTRRDRASHQPLQRSSVATVAAAANVEALAPAEKHELVKSFEIGMRAVAEEFPSPDQLDVFMACAEIRQRLKKQPAPAFRVEALQAAVDDVKEAVEIEDGSRGYIDALKRVIAHGLAAIDEAQAIEAARPDDMSQAAGGDDFSQVRARKARR